MIYYLNMIQPDFITIIVIVFSFAISVYKIQLFHNKNIGYFSIVQFIYLLIIPGIIYLMLYSYLQAILRRPLNEVTFIPDKLLVNILLLAQLFTYGGLAIHSVTKMLSENMTNKKDEAFLLNRYFHFTFSHNLVYGGAIAIAFVLPLVELNHMPPDKSYNLLLSILVGILFSISLVLAMTWYKAEEKDNYPQFNKWSDLKTVLLLGMFGFITLIYAIRKLKPELNEYQLVIPTLTIFSTIALLNFLLIYKKLKRGGFRLYLRLGKQEQKLLEFDQPIINSHNKQSPSK